MKGPAGSSALHIHSGLPTLLVVSHSRLKCFAAGTRFSYDFMIPDLLSFQEDHRGAFSGVHYCVQIPDRDIRGKRWRWIPLC